MIYTIIDLSDSWHRFNCCWSDVRNASRTPFVLHIGVDSMKAICKDGRVIELSWEPQELRDLILSQVIVVSGSISQFMFTLSCDLKVAAVTEATRAHWHTCSLLLNFTEYLCTMVIK